jgi:hypothetical protein
LLLGRGIRLGRNRFQGYLSVTPGYKLQEPVVDLGLDPADTRSRDLDGLWKGAGFTFPSEMVPDVMDAFFRF